MPDLTDAQLDQLITAIGLRPRKGPGARAACGTDGGYRRHLRLEEAPCDACREANTRSRREQFTAPVKDPARLKPIEHGTPKGYKAHRYRREAACEACLVAARIAVRDRARARRAASR